jgi:hypothetical protein
MMQVKPSQGAKSVLAVSGHVGAGHIHSHNGFVQDDSAGFAVAVTLLRQAYPVDTAIESVSADIASGVITVRTKGGGQGAAIARRGVTPQEADLLKRAEGLDGAFSQAAALNAFGRVYGQGVTETPVAFQTACCLAVMDSFLKANPGVFVSGKEDMPGKAGGCIGAHVEIDGVPVAVMALVNASQGGLGPDEDLEGNIMLGDKGRVMKELGMDRLPTIILECKAYAPAICKGLDRDALWVRNNAEVDNTYVYEALLDGVKRAGLPYVCSDTAYPRVKGEMAQATQALGRRIAELGDALANAQTSAQKVSIVAELALAVSQDAGGVTFMDNGLHEQVASGGLIPGTAAVLSMAVSESYIKEWKIPCFMPEDAGLYFQVIAGAVAALAEKAAEAQRQLSERFDFDAARFGYLFED